jgi:hypothetical protein
MKEGNLNKKDKLLELQKYRELVLATLDYHLENKVMHITTDDFDSDEHYNGLKIQTQEHFQKGRLTILKQLFHDLTEIQEETGDLKFNKYLQDKTKYNVDIFKSYFQRVEIVIEKGKITTNNQFYDLNIMVNQLCQAEIVDREKIEILNRLLSEYEQRKTKKPSS